MLIELSGSDGSLQRGSAKAGVDMNGPQCMMQAHMDNGLLDMRIH
jgi:hypothetical protein